MAEAVYEEMVDETPEPIPSYVVRGAKIFCTKGSHYRFLDLPETHGIFIRGKAAMHKNDSNHVPESEGGFGNIPTFGICFSDFGSDRDDVKTSHMEGLIFTLMVEDINDIDLPLEGKRCSPDVAEWIDAKEDAFVDGKDALTIKCTLVCNTGLGCIGFLDDGQESHHDEIDFDDEDNII